MLRNFLLIIVLLTNINPVFGADGYEQIVKQKEEILLTYEDLVELSTTSSPQSTLKEKLYKQLTSPIVVQPKQIDKNLLTNSKLGNFFRIASWNIERGFNVDKIEIISRSLPWQAPTNELLEEINVLKSASIIVLNEVDIGLPRTNYINIAEHLANLFKMGYVFGTEFIEVDPYQLGTKKFTNEERAYLEQKTLERLDNINKEKFLGLHGNAILTKYPVLKARIIRLPDCYSWFEEEQKKLSTLELARREAAKKVFSSKILTELRHGGRMAIIVDLQLPNNQIITVVATHLENRCTPECRAEQLGFLLNSIRDIKNPLILAGDFNTTGTDVSPTSVKKEVLKKVKDPEFIAKQAILSLTPVTFAQNIALNTLSALKKFKDPTSRNVPLILPNKERKFFELVKGFKFIDGNAFDTRGNLDRSHNKKLGLFSNSNEREIKGFKTTFELPVTFGFAKYKLDWIFVKPLNLKKQNNRNSSYAYAPHFGRTLQLVNRAFGDKISDHDPVIVDIPAGEPLF